MKKVIIEISWFESCTHRNEIFELYFCQQTLYYCLNKIFSSTSTEICSFLIATWTRHRITPVKYTTELLRRIAIFSVVKIKSTEILRVKSLKKLWRNCLAGFVERWKETRKTTATSGRWENAFSKTELSIIFYYNRSAFRISLLTRPQQRETAAATMTFCCP